jgi:hypothetical protein
MKVIINDGKNVKTFENVTETSAYCEMFRENIELKQFNVAVIYSIFYSDGEEVINGVKISKLEDVIFAEIQENLDMKEHGAWDIDELGVFVFDNYHEAFDWLVLFWEENHILNKF